MNYKVWNKTEAINGVAASHFLNTPPFKGYNGDIILILSEDNLRVTHVECKDIIGDIYGIDKSLPMPEFIAAYSAKLKELSKGE